MGNCPLSIIRYSLAVNIFLIYFIDELSNAESCDSGRKRRHVNGKYFIYFCVECPSPSHFYLNSCAVSQEMDMCKQLRHGIISTKNNKKLLSCL